jgi:hypothetical protein
MENEILEFVREFNAGLENSNEFNHLNLLDNGFNKGIAISEIFAWSDEDGIEHFKTKALSSLVGQLNLLQEVASNLLDVEIASFFAEKRKELNDKFSEVTLKYIKYTKLDYTVKISGLYNDELMEQFCEVLDEDFKYLFKGLKLDISY